MKRPEKPQKNYQYLKNEKKLSDNPLKNF